MNHKSLFYLQHILNKEAFLSYNQKFLQETAMMQVNPNVRDVALFVLPPVLCLGVRLFLTQWRNRNQIVR